MYKVVPDCRILLLLASLLCWSTAEAARNFPQNAKRGTITAHQYPHYQIDASNYRIAVGGRIFNQHNLIIMPASLRGKAEVMYQLDNKGELSAIWLLTREEAARYPKPITPRSPEDAVGR